MRISFVIEYLGRCHRELKKLSSKGEGTLLYLWWDFIKCSVVHGAILNHYTRGKLYTLKGCERRKSMTYGRILKAYKRCNSPASIPYLNNKHLFNGHFKQYVKRKWLYSLQMDFDQFSALCDSCEAIIIKPENGVDGKAIRKITPPDLLKNRKDLFEELVKSPCMVEECIVQHPEMVYNNTSVNTIRAFSIMDTNGDVHILKMLFRVGVGSSAVDNYSQGGCVYEVDVESGRIISPSLTKKGEEVYVHPGTDVFMLGRQIPLWNKVLEGVDTAHRLLPGCRFIGWDVAVTQEGIELIEGNHNPGYELLEFFGSKGWWKKIQPYLRPIV